MVRRFVLAIIVCLLMFSTSGLPTLIAGEPCTGSEQSGTEDAACPPTCATCGCCAQAVEPAVIPVTSSLEAPATDLSSLIPHLANTSPRDILHVPKPFSA
jgi:hypothetical protein